MRLTFVVHQFPPRFFTGTESYALAVGCELRRRGHDVDVFTLDPAFGEATGPWRESLETVDGLPVRRINYWAQVNRDWSRLEYRHPLLAETFGRHLRQRGTEVVHTFHLRHVGADLIDAAQAAGCRTVVSLTDFWFLCPRVLLMRADGTPCDGPPEGPLGCLPCHAPELLRQLDEHPSRDQILQLHHHAPGCSKSGWDLASQVATALDRPAYLRRQLLRADALVAPTRHLREVFERNGIPMARIAHASYGVDTTGIALGAAAVRGPRPLTFGFCGSFVEHKAPHLLVAALAKVRGDCRLVLRGRPSDFPAYSGPLLAAAAQDPRITVLPPFDRRDLPQVLGAIDVLVVPSTWHENAPFVALEAHAAGLPVLASRFGGLAEVVRDEVDGELFPAGDIDDLARRLQRLLDEPDRLQRYRAAVQPPKTLAKAVDEFLAIYAPAAAR